jgi:redox-sensing transcriptional repressor
MSKVIPEKVSNRLTLYHSIMVEYIESEIETISSPQIAQRLGIDDSQVRKDFKLLNNAGKCRVGYLVKELKDSIEKTLGFTQAKNAFIVGSGHLGIALAKYDNFNSYGLNILALFDNNPEKIGLQINNKNIFDTAKLPNLAKEMNVDIAILTVPRQNAQQVADFLIKSNIKYIWNFTPAVLKVPPHVKVWNENIMGSFLQFACKDMMN